MRLSDLVSEALRSLSVRPWRTVTTAVGTILGVAALVGIVGLASTARQQVSDELDLLEATEVLGSISADVDVNNAEARLMSQSNVVAAALFQTGELTAVAAASHNIPALEDVNVIRVTDGFLEARELDLRWGRWFTEFERQRTPRLAILGSDLADRLGAVGVVGPSPTVWLNGTAHTVIGVIEKSPRMPMVLHSVLLPLSAVPDNTSLTSFVARTDLGDATRVADVLSFVPLPGYPEAVTVVRPPDPGRHTVTIREDIQRLVVGAAVVALAVGVLGIASVTSVSVVERTSELGLRLALGAKRRHLTSQVAIEAALIGFWGGFLGSALGVLIVVVGSSLNGWRPAVSPTLVLSGPGVGLTIGTLAGVIPAYRTSRILPDKALRTE